MSGSFSYRIYQTLLSICLLLPLAVLAKDSAIFSKYNINVAFNVDQPVVAANVLPNKGVELLVVGVDQDLQYVMGIYGFDEQIGKFVELDQIALSNSTLAFDIGESNKAGLQTLYFLSKKLVHAYVPANLNSESTIQKEESVSSMYLTNKTDSFVYRDFVKDINNDGADDIVLPSFESLNLWLSGCCGKRHFQRLPIAARFEVNDSSVTYDDAELYLQDMNQDDKSDIVIVEPGKLKAFLQKADMQFDKQPIEIDLDLSIYGVNWWDMKGDNGQAFDQSNLKHRKVVDIGDFNADKIPDVVVAFTQSSGVLDKVIDYEFFYGRLQDSKLVYTLKANAAVTLGETLSDLNILDIDFDGKQEVMVSSFDIGISQIIGALLSGSIDKDIMIFSMGNGDTFGKKPLVKHEVEVTFSLSSGTSGEPLTKIADVNGDGMQDLIFSDNEDKIKVLLATPNGKRPFAKKALKQRVTIPNNASEVADHDLNGDNKTDFILHYGRADPPELLKQITVLLAR